MKRALLLCLAVLALLGSTLPSLADAPLPPPSVVEVSSPDGSFRAVADPKKEQVVVFRHSDTAPIWSLPGWHRWFFLANDGDHLILGPDGLNLLPLQVDGSQPLIVFMRRTEKVRVVTVGEIFPGLRGLQQTASHFAWGSIVGVSSHNQLIVELVDGRRLAFEVSTGDVALERGASNKALQPTRRTAPRG